MAYMAERKEKILLKYVGETHKSYDDWRKMHKHLSLSADIEREFKVGAKKEKDDKKDDKKAPIPFPSDCVVPINKVGSGRRIDA